MSVHNLRVRPDLLHVASGWNVLITDAHGRVTGTDPLGLYIQGARFLSYERITVDGQEPVAFSTGNVGAHAQLTYATVADGEKLPSEALYLTVERFLGEGLRTRITVHSWAARSRSLELRVELAADFADIGEVQEHRRQQQGEVISRWDADALELRLAYAHRDLDLAAAIRVETTSEVTYSDQAVIVALPWIPANPPQWTSSPNPSLTVDVWSRPRPATANPATRRRPLAALYPRNDPPAFQQPRRRYRLASRRRGLGQATAGRSTGACGTDRRIADVSADLRAGILTASWQALLADRRCCVTACASTPLTSGSTSTTGTTKNPAN